MVSLPELLAKHYGSMNPAGPWNHKATFGNYTAQPTAKMVVQLDHFASEVVVEAHRSRNSKEPLYILIEKEGNLRMADGEVGLEMFEQESPAWTKRWDWAITFALDNGVYVFNARSKKCCRPVWRANLLAFERRLDNMQLESVRVELQTSVFERGVKHARQRFVEYDERGRK